MPLSNELVSLHEINERAAQPLYFDGYICFNDKRRYVERVPFKMLSIGGYEQTDRPTVGPDLWIQSVNGKRSDVWYRLRSPATEYTNYHRAFLWLADLAKFFCDFLFETQQASLSKFREDFIHWLEIIHPACQTVQRWLNEYGSRDFRPIVAAHAHFLYCQASQLDTKYESCSIWAEIHPWYLNAIPEQIEKSTNSSLYALSREGGEDVIRRKTTVTPYVYNCFSDMPWAKFLYCQSPSSTLSNAPTVQNRRLFGAQAPAKGQHAVECNNIQVNIGDVVAVPSDADSSWQSQNAEYLAYVQNVIQGPDGDTLGLLWFYRPADTACMQMRYPFPNEIFLSDHCNCDDPPIYTSEVIRKVHVSYEGPDNTSAALFCRQHYVEADGAWETLQETHRKCKCKLVPPDPQFTIGETLLVNKSSRSNGRLEPVVLLEQNRMQKTVKVRRLLRKKTAYNDAQAGANELVFTDQIEVLSDKTVDRACQIRYFTHDQKIQGQIPFPYNAEGQGNFFYISSQHLQESQRGLEPLSAANVGAFAQGFEPSGSYSQPRLRGLDIFCGGGNFGRGLEDGGAVRFEYAVDYYKEAIHTYKANDTGEHNTTKFFRGSVNQYLSEAMEGTGGGTNGLVAQRGHVDM